MCFHFFFFFCYFLKILLNLGICLVRVFGEGKGRTYLRSKLSKCLNCVLLLCINMLVAGRTILAKSGWEIGPRGLLQPILLSSSDLQRLGLCSLVVIPHWPYPKGFQSYFNNFFVCGLLSLRLFASAKFNFLVWLERGFQRIDVTQIHMGCPWVRHQTLRCWRSPWKQPEHLEASKQDFSHKLIMKENLLIFS